MLTKNFFAKVFLLIAFAVASALLAPTQAQANAYFKIDVNELYFLDGNQIKIVASITNTGDSDGEIYHVNMYSIDVWDGYDDILWSGSADFTGMNLYVPAGRQLRHEFFITDVSVPYYDADRHWKVDYTVDWNNY